MTLKEVYKDPRIKEAISILRKHHCPNIDRNMTFLYDRYNWMCGEGIANYILYCLMVKIYGILFYEQFVGKDLFGHEINGYEVWETGVFLKFTNDEVGICIGTMWPLDAVSGNVDNKQLIDHWVNSNYLDEYMELSCLSKTIKCKLRDFVPSKLIPLLGRKLWQ